jgi:hypothetical protein
MEIYKSNPEPIATKEVTEAKEIASSLLPEERLIILVAGLFG